MKLNSPGHTTHLKVRPHTALFLQKLSKLFHIYIYTMGKREYAKNILKILWKECPSAEIPEQNLISRDDGH